MSQEIPVTPVKEKPVKQTPPPKKGKDPCDNCGKEIPAESRIVLQEKIGGLNWAFGLCSLVCKDALPGNEESLYFKIKAKEQAKLNE